MAWNGERGEGEFRDRRDAGRRLAGLLRRYADREGLIVLGLPRGGVPVAYEVARALAAPLDILVVRKLGVPGHAELAMGAIASGGTQVVNRRVLRELGLSMSAVEAVADAERRELARQEAALRGERRDGPPQLEGRTVIVVDDGLATGASMRAAVRALRAQGAAEIVVAVPVGAAVTCQALSQDEDVDDLVCVVAPSRFRSVGEWYADFAQVSDAEVRALLSAESGSAESGG